MSEVYLLQAVIESFVDGIIVLTETGEWVHANEFARRLCFPNKSDDGKYNSHQIIKEIHRICQSLIERSEVFPEEEIIIESEITTDRTMTLRIRARWLKSSKPQKNFVLVSLEDPQRASQNIAISDAKKYGLTSREAEVWLLRLANHSYQEIADKLYITINTVKKHLKSIRAKQQEMLYLQECEG
ncbi:MAG: sigma factor-like helix-turn-helix DNA-binding protein [Nostocaceae cyanobacterium]|nr:sigma factor-like helix-turn-helix DNA-binding protein [Nostocaceae cyanobacterium]